MSEQKTSTQSRSEDEPQDNHLQDAPDGCGCTEVWEHLSEQRAADD